MLPASTPTLLNFPTPSNPPSSIPTHPSSAPSKDDDIWGTLQKTSHQENQPHSVHFTSRNFDVRETFQDWAFCSMAYLASASRVLLSYSESWGNLRRANFGGFGGLKFGKVQCLCLAHQQQMCSWIIKGHWTAVQCSTDVLMSLNKYVAPGETGQTTNK